MFSYERLDRLFDMLNGASPIPTARLSERLGVSSRTIRTDISKLNAELAANGATVRTKWHEGYRIEVTGEDAYRRFLQQRVSDEPATPSLDSAAERIRETLCHLLLADDYLSIEDLARITLVGENTAAGYVKTIRETLGTFKLECISKRGVGLRIFGTEADRRRCLLEEVLLGGDPATGRLGQAERRTLSGIDLDDLADTVRRAFEGSDLVISDLGHRKITCATGIALKRIAEGHIVEALAPGEAASVDELLPFANAVCDSCVQTEGLPIPECERTHLALIMTQEANPRIASADIKAIDEDVLLMLGVIARDYGIDLRHDDTLRQHLTEHLSSIASLHGTTAPRTNPIITTIRQSFPLAFEATMSSSNEVLRPRGIALSEDEIGYTALHIAAALERRRPSHQRKHKLAIVCDSRPSTMEMLLARIQSFFGNDIDICWTGSVGAFQMLDDADRGNFSCIVSTAPVTAHVIPTLLVDFNLPDQDVKALSRLLEGLDRDDSLNILDLFDENLFSIEEGAPDKADLLADMCRGVAERVDASENPLPLILAREELADTSLNDDFAIPHPIRPCFKQTGVAVRLMRKPLRWSDAHQAVRIVFLLYIQPGDVSNIEPLFNLLVKIVENADLRRSLIECDDFSSFRRALAQAL